MRFSLPLSSTFASALGACALAAACTSGSGAPPTSESAFCSAISSFASRCQLTDPCSKGTVAECAMIAANRSASALQVETDCVQAASCADAGAGASECYTQRVTSLSPTATQTTLAEDFCAVCAGTQTTSACESGFYAHGGDGGTQGPGAAALTLSDAVVTSIDGKCIAGLSSDGGASAAACAATFEACVEQTIFDDAPEPSGCTLASSNDGG